MYWWLTCDLSHQLTSKTSLITSSLRLFGPQGPGSGFGSVCAVSLSDLYDPLPLNEGEQGWEMRHFRAQGFIPTAQWITLQHTKRWRHDSFFKEIFCSKHQIILVSNLQRENLQTEYKTSTCVFKLHHILSTQFCLYFEKVNYAVLIRLTLLYPQDLLCWMLKKKCLSHIQWSNLPLCFFICTFQLSLMPQIWCKTRKDPNGKKETVRLQALCSLFLPEICFLWAVLCTYIERIWIIHHCLPRTTLCTYGELFFKVGKSQIKTKNTTWHSDFD